MASRRSIAVLLAVFATATTGVAAGCVTKLVSTTTGSTGSGGSGGTNAGAGGVSPVGTGIGGAVSSGGSAGMGGHPFLVTSGGGAGGSGGSGGPGGFGGFGGPAVSSSSGLGGTAGSGGAGGGGGSVVCMATPPPQGALTQCGGSSAAGTGAGFQCESAKCDADNNKWDTTCDKAGCTCAFNGLVYCTCSFSPPVEGCANNANCCPHPWPTP